MNVPQQVRLCTLVLAVSTFFTSCTSELPTLPDFDETRFPSAPRDLEAVIGNGSVLLQWSRGYLLQTTSFNIFRRVASDSAALKRKIGSTTLTHYEDVNLDMSLSHTYWVSGIAENGRESALSDSVNVLPGEAISLFEPEVRQGSVLLRWTASQSSDFRNYSIHRSRAPEVTRFSNLLTIISNSSVSAFDDITVDENTLYFYRIFVFDIRNRLSASNEVSTISATNIPPDAVVLSRPNQRETNIFRLTWTSSAATDFASYRLFRSTISPVPADGAPIVVFNGNPLVTQYDDAGLQSDIEYFYRLLVFDRGGLSAASNEVSGTLY